MGNLLTAFPNKTPLIVTAGQQTRHVPGAHEVASGVDERPEVHLGVSSAPLG
jgi:hypothetical protein